MKKKRSVDQQKEIDLKHLDDREMLILTERGIEDFRLGRALSQQQVRSRIQLKLTNDVQRNSKSKPSND